MRFGGSMRRRDFLAVVTGAVAFCTAACAQTAAVSIDLNHLRSNAKGSDAKLIGLKVCRRSDNGLIRRQELRD